MDDAEEPTPIDSFQRRRVRSDKAIRLENASKLLVSLGGEFAQSGRVYDQLPEAERFLYLRRVCDAGRQAIRSLSALIEDMESESFPGVPGKR